MAKKRAMMLGFDGADPVVIKQLIQEGKLPNFKRFMEQGVAHESLSMLGVNPTVTPPNWASLATGNWPRTHGVTCFYSHTLGNDLDMYEMSWDSRRVQSEFIWEAFERAGKKAVMLNYCEAWPPRVENTKNVFVDGTGATPFLRDFFDFQKVAEFKRETEQVTYLPHFVDPSNVGDCIVYSDQIEEMIKEKEQSDLEKAKEHTGEEALDLDFGTMGNYAGGKIAEHHYPNFTKTPPSIDYPAVVVLDSEKDAGGEAQYMRPAADLIGSPLKETKNWKGHVPEGALEGVLLMNGSLERRPVLLVASGGKAYDTLQVYAKKDTATLLGEAKQGANGQWSDYIIDSFTVNGQATKSAYRIRILAMESDGSYAKIFVSQVLNLSDDTYFYPEAMHDEFWEKVGPLCSMASYGRFEPLSDQVTMESFEQIYQWHIQATDYLLKEHSPDWDLFYLHIHGIDSVNHWYISQSIPGGHPQWQRIRGIIEQIYVITDHLLGYYMQYMDDDTALILTSDHAAIPHQPGYKNPGIGELGSMTETMMVNLGLTTVYKNEKGAWKIDWSKSKAVSQRSSYVYLNVKGRDPHGIVEAKDYAKTVQEVIDTLYAYRDPVSGDRVVAFCMTKEEMEAVGLGGSHCGDIFLQLTNNFCLEHANCLNNVTNGGYSLQCLCMMAGGNFEKGKVMTRPVRAVDVVPTICQLCDAPMPMEVEGGIIYQAIQHAL